MFAYLAPAIWDFTKTAGRTKAGQFAAVLAIVFGIGFFVPADLAPHNHFAVLGQTMLSKNASGIELGDPAQKDPAKNVPPPLANLVMFDEGTAMAANFPSAEVGEEENGFYLDTLPTINGVAFLEATAPATAELVKRSESYTYTVEDGDTPGAIAGLFGISLDTLLWANDMTSKSYIRPGQKLTVLPVNGVTHVVAKGDTISSLAKKYNADANDIAAYNNLAADAALPLSTTLVIPDGVRPAPVLPKRVAVQPTTISRQNIDAPTGWLIQPAPGRNPRGGSGIHGFNGIDLANTCGTPIVAAAAGTVIVSDDVGWNGGYGKYIKIQHPNGVITLYGHAKELMIDAGSPVAQGQIIALMGTTGRSTGCHVHFEVRGATNPFRRR